MGDRNLLYTLLPFTIIHHKAGFAVRGSDTGLDQYDSLWFDRSGFIPDVEPLVLDETDAPKVLDKPLFQMRFTPTDSDVWLAMQHGADVAFTMRHVNQLHKMVMFYTEHAAYRPDKHDGFLIVGLDFTVPIDPERDAVPYIVEVAELDTFKLMAAAVTETDYAETLREYDEHEARWAFRCGRLPYESEAS